MSELKPRCWATGCDQVGAFACKRCKVARYCSTSCQRECWAEHKKDCKGKVERPYIFDYSFDRTIPERTWLVSEMKKGPVQSMDPPDEYDFQTWWYDRTVEIGGKVVVRSSFFPPKMKAVIRQGLRNRDLTWEYLFSDNFMAMMIYAWVPLQEMLEQMEWIVIPAESKPSLQGIVENVVEHYWRVRAVPGQLYYDQEMALLLQKLNVTLPFTDSHCYEDELRVYTHDMSHSLSFGPKCDCFTCQARPFKEARMREAWEVLRRKMAKKGMFMMSWSAKQEYEQQMNADSTAGIDTSSKATVLQWTHGEDEKKTVKSSFTKAELSELSKYIDIIHKQQRLPLQEEMDWIMRKVSVSQDRYERETRQEVEKAVAARLKGKPTTTAAAGATKPTTTATTSTATATTNNINSNTTTSHSKATTSTSTTELTSATSASPPVSGTKAGTPDTADTTTTTATASSLVEQCTTKMKSVELSATVGADSGVFTTTGRPQRRAAAKVVSYVDAGASSSDDNHQHNKKEKTTGKSTDTVGDSSDSGGESEEDWNDSSSASEEDESSSSSDSPSEDSDASDVEMSAGADEAAKKNSSNRKSKGAGGVSNVTKAKKPRKIGTASGARVYWDNNMDARLIEAVNLHKASGWTKVAEHVGGGVTRLQCHHRWSNHLKPLQQGLKRGGDWTEAELAALPSLVEEHTIKPYWSEYLKVMTQERIDWKAIGQALGRVPLDCQDKWKGILTSKMKKGPFTAEEDALIRQRVMEWGDKGPGLWVSLQEEMGRPADIIGRRWKTILSKK